MTPIVVGVAAGFVGGVLCRQLVRRLPRVRRVLSRRRGYSVIDLRLTQSELDEINGRGPESEFQNRRDRVGQELGQYADQLAGDDPLLRERLRRFEQRAVS